MISECITRICGSISCQNQTILFFGFLKYCLSSSSCSNWCYLFSIFLTYYTNCSMIFIITGGELHSLQFSWCLCFIFLLFPLLSHCWLHMGSVPSSSSSAECDSPEISQGYLSDNIFITCKMNMALLLSMYAL